MPPAPSAIPVVNLDEDAEGPSPPTNRAPAKTLQSEIPQIISLTPIVETPFLVAPPAPSTTIEDPSAVVTSTLTPDQGVDDSLLGPDS